MNRNIVWGEIFVDELARSGLKAVCAAPGSRHTPLMLAFAKHPDIQVYSHLDERSAAFFALGLALASDEPVALVCSSGTAGANMYPAIIEAHQSRVPLIVLTADRPPELRHSGANQTIDQIKMFGDYVLWFVDMALPEANPPAIAIRNLRTTANRAYAKANGLRKGVVHLNFPFRKPLEPTPVEGDMVDVPEGAEARSDGKPQTIIWRASFQTVVLYENQLLEVAKIIEENPNGVIVIGNNVTGDRRYPDRLLDSGFFSKSNFELSDIILNFSLTTGYPIIAGATSGFRFLSSDKKLTGLTVRNSTIDSIGHDVLQKLNVDVVIRFGSVPTSKEINQFLMNTGAKHIILIKSDGDWSDDNHRITHFIQADEFDITKFELYDILPIHRGSGNEWDNNFIQLEQTTWQTIDHEIETGAYFDGAVVYDVVDLIPDESTLFAGNSLPVRHLDQFGKPQQKHIYTYANRGASGIDGNISTALGTGAVRPDKPLVAILGDITFYHDMNGLLAVHRCGVPITIVLINNDGGGIFNRLPIRDYEPEFTDYFITPHGLDFSHAAKLYGLDYVQVDARDADSKPRECFRKTFSDVVGSKQSTIIEVRTDGKFDEHRRQEIVAAVHKRIADLDI